MAAGEPFADRAGAADAGTVCAEPAASGPGGVGEGWLGQLDAVPALALGQVEGGVGEALEPVEGARLAGEAGHADRGGDRHVGARQGDLGDRGADALGDLQRRVDLGVRQQDRELLAAVAAGEVPGPQHAAQRRADVREHLVPHRVPALVVDLLEVVQVEQEQGERRLGGRGLRERPLQRVGDGALVGQPGEPVGGGADLRHGQVAQVGQHRRRLADRLADPLLLGLGVGRRAAEQDRADHLAADRERDAGRGTRAPGRTPGRTAGPAARRSPGASGRTAPPGRSAARRRAGSRAAASRAAAASPPPAGPRCCSCSAPRRWSRAGSAPGGAAAAGAPRPRRRRSAASRRTRPGPGRAPGSGGCGGSRATGRAGRSRCRGPRRR